MIQLILIPVIGLIVYAIHYTMLEGEIFGFVRKWWDKKQDKIYAEETAITKQMDAYIPSSKQYAALEKEFRKKARQYDLLDKIKEPIFNCPICMVPWHSLYIYPILCFCLELQFMWKLYAILAVGAMGFNYVIAKLSPPKDD